MVLSNRELRNRERRFKRRLKKLELAIVEAKANEDMELAHSLYDEVRALHENEIMFHESEIIEIEEEW